MKKAYQLKIQLREFKPSVYRTILVDPDKSFEVLHNYIQQLFGFENSHMYSFTVWDRRNSFEIVMSDEEKYNPSDKVASKTKIKDILQTEKDKVLYTYDFGDSWEFDVKLEKIVETDEKLPKVLRWKGGFLIEDCGWAWWLEDLLEIYEKKDEKEAENRWYDDFEMLEYELKNTILKEINWKEFELDDKLERWF